MAEEGDKIEIVDEVPENQTPIVEAENLEEVEGVEEEEGTESVIYHTAGDKISLRHEKAYIHLPNIARMRNLENEPQKFFHRVIDFIVKRDVNLFEEFRTNVGNDSDALDGIVSALVLLFREAVGRGLEPSLVLEDLHAAGLDDPYGKAVAEACHARREEIRIAQLEELSSICPMHLADFDWKVGVALASDKLSDLNLPLCTLNLNLKSADSGSKDVVIELPRNSLSDLITQLEKANNDMQKMLI